MNEAQTTTEVVERESSAVEASETIEAQRVEVRALADEEKREDLKEEVLDPHAVQRSLETISVSGGSVRAIADSSTYGVGAAADSSTLSDKPLFDEAQEPGERRSDCIEEKTMEEETSGEGREKAEEEEQQTETDSSNEAEDLQNMEDDDTITGDPAVGDFTELAQEYNELAQEYLDSDNGDQEE